MLNSTPSFGAGSDSTQIRHIVEGLLAHFFSLHQSSYHPQDMRWLLEMANLQTHWQATYLISEIVEVGCVLCESLSWTDMMYDASCW